MPIDIRASTRAQRRTTLSVPGLSRYHPRRISAGGTRIPPRPVIPVRRRLLLAGRTRIAQLGFAIGRRFPLRSRVVFAVSHADAISGNLAFIRDELDRRTPRIPYLVLAYRHSMAWRRLVGTFVHIFRAGFHLASSKVFIVDNYFYPIYVIRPRPGTTIVQTWHASGAFKKIGWSVVDKRFGASEELVSRVNIHSNYDVCLMGSKSSAVHYAEAFHQPLERFATDIGIPRTDILFGDEKVARIKAAVRARYALPAGKRVILYAPTFRGESMGKATTPQDLDLAEMAAQLSTDHVLLLKLHPFVRRSEPVPAALRPFVIDASDHPDINELMLVSDVLVTDYSSAIFEFSLLERPMVFFAPDHDDYLDERGFYWDYRTGVPGPVFETTREVAAYLRAGAFDLDRVRRFRDESFEVADGHATERFVDRIVIPALR